ncbi:MAG: nickel pincer cofactor biosynthesis protein LarB, partial [Desulfobacca sp.]
MDPAALTKLLQEVQSGRLSIAEAQAQLLHLPFENLGFAHVDHHRYLRQGFPEVVFAAGKSVAQLQAILTALSRCNPQILVTRLTAAKAKQLQATFPAAVYHAEAQVLTFGLDQAEDRGRGLI